MSRIIASFLLLVTWLLAACSSTSTLAPAEVVVGQQVSTAGGIYTDVSVAELQIMLANKDFTFVNVHIPFEGNIADTDLSIAHNEIEQNLGLSPADKDAERKSLMI